MQRRFIIAAAILAASIICVASVWFFFMQGAPPAPSAPDFLVTNEKGELREHTRDVTDLYFTFNITNNGTATANDLNGTVKPDALGWQPEQWSLNKPEYKLVVGENCMAWVVFYQPPPETPKNFIVTVTCSEGIQRQFNVTVNVTIP